MLYVSITVGNVSKYGAFSGAYFPAFGPEKTPYLDTFHTVRVCSKIDSITSSVTDSS